ncbi:MAG: RES family NAD+ phosphorylase [Candidatus Eremiobacteraeota bacterium]|nr:RES family NAD+ phosphorylase [Candidatus Eremiobacteraeota bacterium]
MVRRIRWSKSYRLISTIYPTRSIYDRICDSANLEQLLQLEALTNPRALLAAGDFRKVRPQDRISGPGTTPVMASFAYSGPGRFCDGTYGVYYGAHDLTTAVHESRYHTETRLREWHEPSGVHDKRAYVATIAGSYDDVTGKGMRSKIYDPVDYTASQQYGAKRYGENVVDGIVFNSVRRAGGTCVAAFRPRLITRCRVEAYIQFSWDGSRITGSRELTKLTTYGLD